MISSVTVEVQHQKQRDISQDSADIEKSESTSHYRTSGIALHKYTAMLLAQQLCFVPYLPFQSFKVYLSFFHPLFRVKIE